MKRTANARWSGGLKDGKGSLDTTSGALKNVPYNFRNRFEEEPGTNPEELVAAAHAGCYAMALSGELGSAGFTATNISVKAVVRRFEAVGVIVWVWDELAAGLRPALAHGYSDTVLAQLPTVRPDADNATAAAFRAGELCAINGSDRANGALVAPLLTPRGCAGVLAFELPHGSEGKSSVRAVVTIMAAQLSQLMSAAEPAEMRPEVEPVLRATGRR